MTTYSDHEQRLLDQRSGAELDRLEARRRAFRALGNDAKAQAWALMPMRDRELVRDTSGLIPALVGLEGWRLEATYPDGGKRRFYVGRSTGWRPCHIEVSRSNTYSGPQVYWPQGTT